MTDPGDKIIVDEIGAPDGEGESWADLAERRRPDVTFDLSCPNGCFDLEIEGHHDLVDAADYLMEVAIQEDPGPCPHCGAEIEPEVTD